MLKKTLFFILISFTILVYSKNLFIIHANSELNQITKQIEENKKKQNFLVNQIKETEKKVLELISLEKNLQIRLNKLKEEKKTLLSKIEELNKEYDNLNDLISKFEHKIENSKQNIKYITNYIYKHGFFDSNLTMSEENSVINFISSRTERMFLIDAYKQLIKDYNEKVDQLNLAKEKNKENKRISESTLDYLESQIQKIDADIKKNQLGIANLNFQVGHLKKTLEELNLQTKYLTQRQQELLAQELAKMNSAKQTKQKPLEKGKYYFMGRGRDLVEGHGLGMSQWGAHGMASLGWHYEKILTFYYPGTVIGKYEEPEKIFVTDCSWGDCSSGYPQEAKSRGYLTIDEYLAGIGEVPNSWPSESIKAQIVAARTYLMRVCGDNKECRICGTAKCQVYNGGTGKMQFVIETKQKVILYNNQPIVAFYSASHRGCSSRLSTVWGVRDLPYIQVVKDDEYSTKDYFTSDPYDSTGNGIIYPYNWVWRTNSYSLEELSNIFNKNEKLMIGELLDINIQRDECGRVGKITLRGSKGEKTLTGWDFRAIFNVTTTYNDYIYSTEFGFYKYE